MLLVRYDKRAFSGGNPSGQTSWYPQASRLDLRTGEILSCTGLNNRLSQLLSPLAPTQVYLSALSPDHTRILAWDRVYRGTTPRNGDQSDHHAWMMALDGSHQKRLPFHGRSYLIWRTDNQSLFAYSFPPPDTPSILRRPNHKTDPRSTESETEYVRLSVYHLGESKAAEQSVVREKPYFYPIGCTSAGYLLTVRDESAPEGLITDNSIYKEQMTFLLWDGNGSGKEIGRYSVPYPSQHRPDNVLLSPEGSRLAWIFHRKPRPATNWLEDLVTRLNRREYSLWVSRLDGSDLHTLGAITPARDENYKGLSSIEAVSWSPDGKRLSFLYQQTLYTVPAD